MDVEEGVRISRGGDLVSLSVLRMSGTVSQRMSEGVSERGATS